MHEFLSIDLLPLLAGAMAALSCGLLGNLLVLRRVSMMGDAISHAVLPGIVVGFLVAGTRSPIPIFIGAAGAALVTVVLVEVVRTLGRVESGAAMGVVFSVMFALGVALIETAAARNVDLDADCVLYGQLETLFWFPPDSWSALLSAPTLGAVPRQVWTLAGVVVIAVLFVGLFFKELRLAAFDPMLATALGFRARWLDLVLMALVAASTVAAFEAVGSILVVAMLVCPAATARLLTDRLATQIGVSVVAALAASVGGYWLAAWGPGWLGATGSVSAAGMMAVTGGVLFAGVFALAPNHGLAARVVRRAARAIDEAAEDALASCYRAGERGESSVEPGALRRAAGGGLRGALGVRAALARGELARSTGGLALTGPGAVRATEVVRSHRLWESFLVEQAGLRPDHVHDTAMRLEHLRRAADHQRLAPERVAGVRDPHDRPIPGEPPSPAP